MPEDQFRILAESASDGILIADGDGTYVYASPGAARITGYSVDELLRSSITDLAHPDEIEKLMARFRGRLSDEPVPAQYEATIVRADGVRLPVELTAAKTTWRGEPSVMVVFRDISRRKETEETLRYREARFRSLVQNSSDITMVVGPDGTALFVSPSLARILGHRAEDILGLNTFDFVHPDDLGPVRSTFAQIAQGTITPAPRQLRIRNAEGAWIWVEGVATNMLDDPDVEGIVINARDISERKRAEEALRESEENWRSLTENSPDYIMLLDREGIIQFVNHTVPDLDRSEVIGTPVYDYVPPEFHATMEACFRRVLETGRPDQYEVDYYTADGDIQNFEARVGPVIRDGETVGFSVDSTDVTARRHAEEALRRNEERYRTLFEGANDAIFIMDQDRFVDCNQMALTMLACRTKEDVVGHTTWEFGPATQPDGQDSQSKGRLPMEAALAGAPQAFYWQCKRKDGTLIDAEISLNRIDLGRKVYIQAVVRDITASRQAEEILKATVESARCMLWYSEVRDDGKRLHWDTQIVNEEATRALFPVAQEPGQSYVEAWQAAKLSDVPFCEDDARKALFQPGTHHFGRDYRVRTREGTRWVYDVMHSKAVGRGQWEIIGVCADVTESRQDQEALQVTVQAARCVLWYSEVEESDGRLVWDTRVVNDRTAWELFPLEAVPGEDFISAWHKAREVASVSYAREIERKLFVNRASQQTWEYTIRLPGETRWVLEVMHATPLGPGRWTVVGVCSDITEHRRADDALRESEERFRAIAEASPMIVAITRMADGKVLYANDAFFETFGFDPSSSAEVTTPEVYARPSDREILLQALKRDGELIGHELELRRADGTRFWALGSFQVLAFDGEKAIFGSILDITDRKRMVRELASSGEQLRSLAMRLAQSEETERQRLSRELHDRTGQELAAVGISLNLLRGQLNEEGSSEAADRLEDVLDQVEQTAQHVRDLMSDLRPAVLDDYGVPAALRWFAEQFSDRTRVAVDVVERGEVPRMGRDIETALFRIAQEALTNVAKHARAKHATISLTATERGAEMVVADDGVGFDVDEEARSTERDRWGMVTMRERALAVRGALRVEPEPGKGTRVVVEVPVGEGQAASSPESDT